MSSGGSTGWGTTWLMVLVLVWLIGAGVRGSSPNILRASSWSLVVPQPVTLQLVGGLDGCPSSVDTGGLLTPVPLFMRVLVNFL